MSTSIPVKRIWQAILVALPSIWCGFQMNILHNTIRSDMKAGKAISNYDNDIYMIMIGTGLCHVMMEKYGRRQVIRWVARYTAGAGMVVTGVGLNQALTLMAVGCLFTVVPVYLFELAPRHARTKFALLHLLFFHLGEMISEQEYLVFLSRLPYWVATILGVFTWSLYSVCLAELVPESLHWLMIHETPQGQKLLVETLYDPNLDDQANLQVFAREENMLKAEYAVEGQPPVLSILAIAWQMVAYVGLAKTTRPGDTYTALMSSRLSLVAILILMITPVIETTTAIDHMRFSSGFAFACLQWRLWTGRNLLTGFLRYKYSPLAFVSALKLFPARWRAFGMAIVGYITLAYGISSTIIMEQSIRGETVPTRSILVVAANQVAYAFGMNLLLQGFA